MTVKRRPLWVNRNFVPNTRHEKLECSPCGNCGAELITDFASIPDHRRAERKRFDLSAVLLYAILAMIGGANSYGRCMSSFARISSV